MSVICLTYDDILVYLNNIMCWNPYKSNLNLLKKNTFRQNTRNILVQCLSFFYIIKRLENRSQLLLLFEKVRLLGQNHVHQSISMTSEIA